VRDFTYVADIVNANILAATRDVPPATVVNVAGGSSITMDSLIELVGEVAGKAVPIDHRPGQPGDVEMTGGNIDRAERLLGWRPLTDLREGLRRQWDTIQRRGD
jgi:nucleoside-diphosphate-sugar epimerase